ncbi:hypothetical protein [Rubellicoccus peritrichatus]|uniref:PEP-CTERM protein-sorting domain-containing protein n=1 Tax=Rubellicoccus peritrichatus TaxID=3080537 RepID=A0AAQ3QUP7_9BACT|nr:hypothetical protein [Puniceicoccus sp. CR14]WOO42601.1 hypothetical protein RZN69_05820 [Puniceicoccus sp. CR14]
MKNKILISLCSIAVAATVSAQTTIIDDDFSSFVTPPTAGTAETSQLVYRAFNGSGASDLSGSGSGVLNMAPITGFSGVYGYLETEYQLMNVGDKFELKFDITYTSGPNADFDGFRVGLYNDLSNNSSLETGSTGYITTINTGAATGSATRIWRDDNQTNGVNSFGTDLTSSSGSSTYIFSGTETVTFAAEMVVSGIQLTVGSTGSGTIANSIIDTTSFENTFDMFAISNGGQTTGFNIDNLSVVYTQIPENSTVSIVAGISAMLTILVFRRRR